jgi:uncharacterized protein (DUF362 family)
VVAVVLDCPVPLCEVDRLTVALSVVDGVVGGLADCGAAGTVVAVGNVVAAGSVVAAAACPVRLMEVGNATTDCALATP